MDLIIEDLLELARSLGDDALKSSECAKRQEGRGRLELAARLMGGSATLRRTQEKILEILGMHAKGKSEELKEIDAKYRWCICAPWKKEVEG